jgi:hypothetical protein
MDINDESSRLEKVAMGCLHGRCSLNCSFLFVTSPGRNISLLLADIGLSIDYNSAHCTSLCLMCIFYDLSHLLVYSVKNIDTSSHGFHQRVQQLMGIGIARLVCFQRQAIEAYSELTILLASWPIKDFNQIVIGQLFRWPLLSHRENYVNFLVVL